MTTETELSKSVETALAAFNEMKGMVEGFGKKLNDISPKMDGFDKAKFEKMADDIGKGIELSQQAELKAKAAEDEQKALKESYARLEGEMDGLKTAVLRPGPGADAKDAGKELSTRRTKLFNDFARLPDDGNKVYFDSHLRKAAADEAEYKALTVNSDPNGGYLVTPEFGGVIQTKIYESSPIRQLASQITIGTDTWEAVLDNDQNTSGWVGEAASRPDTTTPGFGKLTIYVNELYTQPKASQKMLDDAAIDIEAWIAAKAAEEFGRKEATAFVSGSGVMQPKGFLSYPNGTDVAQQQIQQVNSGSAGAFTYAGLVNLQSALKEQYQANATFLFQRATVASIMTIVDGQSRPIFNLMFDKNVGLEPTVMGRPARFANDMPAVASAALAAAYGDFREAYQIVDRAGVRVLRDPFTDKPNVRFYTTKRVGGGVKNFEAIKLQKLS